jgi:hypothetical protein
MYYIYKLLLLFVLYCQESFYTVPVVIMTSSISILVDLWNTEKRNMNMNMNKIQMPGNHPKERIQHSERGKSLKSRNTLYIAHCSSAGFHNLSIDWK